MRTGLLCGPIFGHILTEEGWRSKGCKREIVGLEFYNILSCKMSLSLICKVIFLFVKKDLWKCYRRYLEFDKKFDQTFKISKCKCLAIFLKEIAKDSFQDELYGRKKTIIIESLWIRMIGRKFSEISLIKICLSPKRHIETLQSKAINGVVKITNNFTHMEFK